MADASAPSPPQVLQQSAEVPKGSFPLCLRDGAPLQDGFVEVQFKAISGAAGLAWRAQERDELLRVPRERA